MNVFGSGIVPLAIAFVFVFVAGIVRGYSGFGFAMIAVTGLSLVYPPIFAVPLVLVLEVLASITLIPHIWRDIDWHSLRWLMIGALLATPLGITVLATVPAAPMRIGIAVLVLIAALALRSGWRWQEMPGKSLIVTTGVASGLLNGAAAIGGPPVILFYLSSPAGIAVSRASIIVYFLGLDAMSLLMAALHGLVYAEIVFMAVFCLVPLFLGISLGNRLFGKADKERFRQYVLILLMLLSGFVLIRAALSW